MFSVVIDMKFISDLTFSSEKEWNKGDLDLLGFISALDGSFVKSFFPKCQAPATLQLKLFTNSTRRASWDSKLGYQPVKIGFYVPVKSLYADGGMVGRTDLVILRKYPMQVVLPNYWHIDPVFN